MKQTSIEFDPGFIIVEIGEKDSRWYRIKQLLRWIWKGKMEFKA